MLPAESFEILKEGEVDPLTGKTVKLRIYHANNCLVYVDNEMNIEWRVSGDTGADLGAVLNRGAHLESKARFITNPEQLLHVKRLIAEGIARYLDSSSLELSNEIHNIVESEVNQSNIRMSWYWYFNSVYLITVIAFILLASSWLLRVEMKAVLGATAFEVILASLAGSVGGIISIISRGSRINLDANAGKDIHTTEGVARVVAGIVGAGFVGLAYKGGIFMSGINFEGSPLAVLLTIAIVAGASERLVPSLIERVENQPTQKQD